MRRLLMVVVIGIMTLCNMASSQPRALEFVIADVNGQYHMISLSAFKKRMLLIYFMPDCDDCRAFTKKLIKNGRLFDNFQVTMVTNSDLGSLKKFVTDFRLDDKKGLIIGTEGWTATLQRSLKIERFPFVAIYKTKGILIRKFSDPNSLFSQTL